MAPRPSAWSAWHTVAAAILLAVASFVQFSVAVGTRQGEVIHGDATKYVFYAYNLKYRHTFSYTQSFGPGHESAAVAPDKMTLPGYPAFLSLFVGGVPDTAFLRRATVAQAGLAVGTVLLAFLLALRLMPLSWALAAGLIVAIQPQLAVVATHLMTETLFAFLATAFFVAMLAAAGTQDKRRYAFAGLLLGLASLVRPQLQLLPWLALAVVLVVPRLRPKLPLLLAGLLAFLAIVGPWFLRNAQLERAPGAPDLLVSTLYHGSFPGFMYRDDPRTLAYAYRFDPQAAAATQDMGSVLAHIGHAFQAQPLKYAHWYLVGKPAFFLSWGFIEGASDIFIYRVDRSPYLDRPLFAAMHATSRALHWPLMLLAVAGTLVALWRPAWLSQRADVRVAMALLGGVLLSLVVLHAIGAPYPRYNLPFRPLAYVLGLAFAQQLIVRLRARRA